MATRNIFYFRDQYYSSAVKHEFFEVSCDRQRNFNCYGYLSFINSSPLYYMYYPFMFSLLLRFRTRDTLNIIHRIHRYISSTGFKSFKKLFVRIDFFSNYKNGLLFLPNCGSVLLVTLHNDHVTSVRTWHWSQVFVTALFVFSPSSFISIRSLASVYSGLTSIHSSLLVVRLETWIRIFCILSPNKKLARSLRKLHVRFAVIQGLCQFSLLLDMKRPHVIFSSIPSRGKRWYHRVNNVALKSVLQFKTKKKTSVLFIFKNSLRGPQRKVLLSRFQKMVHIPRTDDWPCK